MFWNAKAGWGLFVQRRGAASPLGLMDYMCRVGRGNCTAKDDAEAFLGSVHTAEARTLLRR